MSITPARVGLNHAPTAAHVRRTSAGNRYTSPLEALRMAYLLGIDIGTSGTKTLLCDQKGKVLATAMAEHAISSPKPGWSEQNPQDWWNASGKATKAVLKKA